MSFDPSRIGERSDLYRHDVWIPERTDFKDDLVRSLVHKALDSLYGGYAYGLPSVSREGHDHRHKPLADVP